MMKQSVTVVFVLLAALTSSVIIAEEVAEIYPYTIVEQFDARLTVQAEMPGTSRANGGTRFEGTITVSELSFALGAVPFDGKWIEFAGKEEEFMRSSYSGYADFPAGSGEVKVTGYSEASGAVSGYIDFTSVFEVGDSFSKSSLDVGPVGTEMDNSGVIESWSSTAVPELNAARVSCATADVLTEVDASSGLAVIQISGDVRASNGEPASAEPVTRQASGGLLLLCMGLLGRGLLALRHRR